MHSQIIAYVDAYMDITLKDKLDKDNFKEFKETVSDELLQKYDILIDSGMSEEEAYHATIVTIQDAIGLPTSPIKRSIKSALCISLGVFLFIAAIGGFPLLQNIIGLDLTIFIFFLLVGIGVALITFDAVSKQSCFKTKSSLASESDESSLLDELQNFLSALLWIGTIIIFFIIKSHFMYSWLIFLIATIIQCLIGIIFKVIRHD